MLWAKILTFALLFSCVGSAGLDPAGAACGTLPLRPSACLSAPVEYAPEGDCTFDAILCSSDRGIEGVSKRCLNFRKYEAEQRQAQATQASWESEAGVA